MAVHARSGPAARPLTRPTTDDAPDAARPDAWAAPSEHDLVELAHAVQATALRSGVTVATAESCTGGLVGHVLTEVPGSSGYYVGGIVSYADDVKVEALGVDRGVIERHGAVSDTVAAAMADGARSRLGADLAAAVTGIAGPAGDTTEKPVGLTYVAVAGPGGTVVRRHVWAGDRSANKRASAAATLELLLERLTATTEPDPGR